MLDNNFGDFWWMKEVDAIIKGNSIAYAMPSLDFIAKEVVKQRRQNNLEERGTGLLCEQWMEHMNEVDIGTLCDMYARI